MGGFNTQKIFKLVRMAALVMPAAGIAMSGDSTANKISNIKRDYFGIEPDGRVNLGALAKGWGPYLMAIGVTYGIPKLAGIIRGL